MEYDENYFKERKFSDKHYKETMQWIDYFKLDENSDVLDFGCGLGFYGHALRYLGIDNVWGYEISKFACENGYELMKDRILDDINWFMNLPREPRLTELFDFILCYDVMEHVPEEQVNQTVNLLYSLLKPDGHILFSICMIGDSNLEKDKTHLTKKTRIWWEYWIQKAGFQLIPVPDYFYFKNQLIIGRK